MTVSTKLSFTVNVRYYSLSEVILSSGKLSVQISRIVLLIVVFNLLEIEESATWIIIFLITIYFSLLLNLKNENGKYIQTYFLLTSFALFQSLLPSGFRSCLMYHLLLNNLTSTLITFLLLITFLSLITILY